MKRQHWCSNAPEQGQSFWGTRGCFRVLARLPKKPPRRGGEPLHRADGPNASQGHGREGRKILFFLRKLSCLFQIQGGCYWTHERNLLLLSFLYTIYPTTLFIFTLFVLFIQFILLYCIILFLLFIPLYYSLHLAQLLSAHIYCRY